MKKIVLLGLFGIFLSQNLALGANICTINNMHTADDLFVDYDCLKSVELDAVKLDKNSRFIVQSLQPMNSNSPVGSVIEFVTIRDVSIYPGAKPAKILFTGEIVENKPPRLAGRSSTLKLEISKMTVDKITYPTVAYISKMGKKNVMTGMLSGNSIYLTNLADTANRGTITIDKVYKDPCQYSCDSVKTPVRPLYYLGGAFLQLADLFVAPIVSVFKRGEEIDIPQYTSFEIKLDDSISVLKL